jgi:replication-associated recombination protein RarA
MHQSGSSPVPGKSFVHPPTRRGYQVHEVISALQKAIRRSEVEPALYWAIELDKSGHTGWAWSRLLTVASEDIGAAAPGLVSDVKALHSIWKEGKSKGAGSGGLQMVHATILMAAAPKSRLVNFAAIVHGSDHMERLEIPDEALDRHTRRGLRMGRGMEHFMEEGGKLVQPDESGVDLAALEAAYVATRWKFIAKETADLPDNPWPPMLPAPEKKS